MADFPVPPIAGPPGCLSLTPDCAEAPQETALGVCLVVRAPSEEEPRETVLLDTLWHFPISVSFRDGLNIRGALTSSLA